MKGSRIPGASWLVGLATFSALTLGGCGTTPLFPTGSATATFTWHSIGSSAAGHAPQPYTGTIAGIPVQGRALAPPTEPGVPVGIPSRLELVRWTGTFEGRTFALAVTLLASGPPATATVDVDGTFGSQNVRFVVGPEPVSATMVHFHGTVGPHHVTGSVRPSQRRGAINQATASFTVTG